MICDIHCTGYRQYQHKNAQNFWFFFADNQPPQVDRCISPPPFIKNVNSDAPVKVEWAEPEFSDNSKQPITIKFSHKMADAMFDTGVTEVAYSAVDKSGNRATCTVRVEVQG